MKRLPNMKILDRYGKFKMPLELLRYALILGGWVSVLVLLILSDIWGKIAWIILWIPLGLIITINVVGFLTLPLYWLAAKVSWKLR